MTDTGPPHIRVRLIGHFVVLRGDAPVRTPKNTERLVALLVLRDVELPRRRTSELLWPDDPQARATSHLRTLLHRLRGAAEGLIDDEDHFLSLGAGVAVDQTDWSAWATRLLTGRWGATDLERRAPRHGFELAAELEDDWALIERERFRQRCMHALERQARLLVEQERYVEAIDVGLSAMRLDPYRESIHEVIISSHLAAGNRVEARRQFDLYVRLLHRDLGLAPSPRLEGLVSPGRNGSVPPL